MSDVKIDNIWYVDVDNIFLSKLNGTMYYYTLIEYFDNVRRPLVLILPSKSGQSKTFKSKSED